MSKQLIVGALKSLKDILLKDVFRTLSENDAVFCKKRMSELFDYTVVGGKYIRARLVISAFNAVDRKAPTASLEQAAKVAGCLELLQAYFLILDDIVDGGTMRRGKPCWHTLDGVGLNSINDGFFLECAMDRLLRIVLKQHPLSSAILDVFLKAKTLTLIGQLLDNSTKGLGDCTWERYKDIVNHKTAYYTKCAPVLIGLLLADERKFWLETEPICYRLGYLFQAQDDFLDCFGSVETTGKNGMDLKDGKCTWISCKAVEKLSLLHNGDMLSFQAHFGRNSDASVEILKKILFSLDMVEEFVNFEKEHTEGLLHNIDALPHFGLRNVLRVSLADCLNRSNQITSSLLR